MTEKEKASQGMIYDANNDPELMSEQKRAKAILFEYNGLSPFQEDRKKEIITDFFGKVGQNFVIHPPFHCDYGYNIEVGDNFFANMNLVILDGAKVSIGDNVFIGPNVGIYTAGHPLDVPRRNMGLEYAYPVNIGNNVWIGAQATILPGVTIGDNAVIGAGSVVTKDIPANVLAVGNPCKVKRIITDEDQPLGKPV
ncbi:MAG TPA: maltose acetyltransferase [Dysgonomonas sp.]|nr:maltose acetyltransferase [Dysgonomonas sp.]